MLVDFISFLCICYLESEILRESRLALGGRGKHDANLIGMITQSVTFSENRILRFRFTFTLNKVLKTADSSGCH